MDEKTIDDIIKQFSAESDAEKELLKKIEAEISDGKIPPKTELDSLMEGINKLNSIYSSAYAFTKQNVMENELPANGSPIFTLKKAIESSEMIALKKKVESKKAVLSKFIMVHSDVEQYAKYLAPSQKKASELLEKINSSDTLSASKLLGEAELPELFMKAMNADPATEDGIVTISLAGEKFGPVVLVGLSSKQYSIPGENNAAAASENTKPEATPKAAPMNPAPVQKTESMNPAPTQKTEPISPIPVQKTESANPVPAQNAEPVKPVATIHTIDTKPQKEESSEDYNVAAVVVRNAFMSQPEADQKPDTINSSSLENGIFKKYDSLQKLYHTLLEFKNTAGVSLDKYADKYATENAKFKKELDDCINHAKDLYRKYVEEPLKEPNSMRRYMTTSDLILKKSVLSDCLEVVKDNDMNGLEFISSSLHEFFIDEDAPIDFANISKEKVDSIIDEAWYNAEDKIRKKSVKLQDSLRAKLTEKIENCLEAICKWYTLCNSATAKQLTAYQKCCPEIIKYAGELQKQLMNDIERAKKASNPDTSVITGMNSLVNTVKEISEKVSA